MVIDILSSAMAAGAINFTSPGVKAGGYDIGGDVLAGIKLASSQTGVDFGYLMAQAAKESGFNASAKARSSSAAGLYQFVEQTWLSVVRKHGAEHGLGDLAEHISFAESGGLRVDDPAIRQEILDLRRDPKISAIMAAEHAADNKAILEAKLKRPVDATDLYMAHFLGVSGAGKFLDAMAKTPNKSAAQMFSHAAAANPAVFYRKDGTARSVREVYDRFDQRMDEDIALFDGLDDGAPAIGKQNPSESAPKMLAAAVGSLASKIHPVSVLSPAILVALASLPVLRGGDKEDTGNKRSLFEQSLMSKPLA